MRFFIKKQVATVLGFYIVHLYITTFNQKVLIMPRKKIVNINQINGNNLTEKNHDFYIKYLEKGIQLIDSMSRRHSKVLQERVDLRYPTTVKSDGANTDFSSTLQNYTKDLTRKKVDVQYFARREQSDQSDNPHLHVAILVDGNKRRCRQTLLESMEKYWANTLKMPVEEVHAKKLVYPCNHDQDGNPRPNGYMLERNAIDFNDTREAMIRQLSYLTKHDSEDITPSSTRKFFISQFQKDEYRAAEIRRYYASKKGDEDK
jgi:hypothetical protein